MRWIAALLALLLLVSQSQQATAKNDIQSKIKAQRAKAQQLQAQLHKKRLELRAAQSAESDLQSQLDATNTAISTVTAHLSDLGAQQHSTQSRLAWNTIQLGAAQRSLRLQDGLLKGRLVDIYERGDSGYLNVLLSATSFSDFVERWDDLRLLVAANQRAVRARRQAEEHVASVEAALDRTRLALQQQQVAQEQARTQLGALAGERRNLVALADEQRRHVATQVAQLEDLTAAEEARLEALIQERQRQLAEQRRAAGIAGAPSSIDSAVGSFSWPVSGTITSPYGWRRNPFGGGPEFHQGLDIAAPTGTTVTAAASGTVIMAQWYGGYGNYILIDNGNGYSTGYGHLSAIYVTSGQQIRRGQAIGAVGSTGASTGPHLHFEVRMNGKPVDPTSRLH